MNAKSAFFYLARPLALACLAAGGFAAMALMNTAPGNTSAQATALNLSAGATDAAAKFQSGWVKGKHFQARLTLASPGLVNRLGHQSGKQTTGHERLAGLQIRLSPKWKTYWRSPGSSGFPPRFDWSRSENIKSVELLWPAPTRYIDKYAITIGYKDEVVIPIKFSLKDAARPAVLKLRMEFGVCDYICVQAEASLRADVPRPGAEPEQNYTDSLIGYFYRRVPKTLTADAAMRVLDVTLTAGQTGKGGGQLLIKAQYPNGAKKRDLFVEAGPDLYLAAPQRIGGGTGSVARFAVDVSSAGDLAALKGRELILTLVSDNAQGETRWTLN